ncbi:unnamed protein product [Pseudo-nitzschia multistriata]|uniref:Uncharacterized protein n=1 Tax=Pseudo-nitzschia multistriata TaxID=183589 RepID=A0A448ZJK9_9STRA|nr:unnamed protein product [Pseudo-nitzschia multistriata]
MTTVNPSSEILEALGDKENTPIRRSHRKRKSNRKFADMSNIDSQNAISGKNKTIARKIGSRNTGAKSENNVFSNREVVEKENATASLRSSVSSRDACEKEDRAAEGISIEPQTPASSSSECFSSPMVTKVDSECSRISKQCLSVRSPPLSTAQMERCRTTHSNGQTPTSILRRRCAPAKEGYVYDGTTREADAVDPTSNCHFESLLAFAASTSSPTKTCDSSKGIAPSLLSSPPKQVELDLEALGNRLKELFPKQFSRVVGRAGRRPRNIQRSIVTFGSPPPPCILPRLIGCYTMYRDSQRRQHHARLKLFVNDDDSLLMSNDLVDRPTKICRKDSTADQEEATAAESLYPIHNLLNKLVHLEWTVLAGHEHRDEQEGKNIPSPTAATSSANSALAKAISNCQNGEHQRKRRVQFAAFDDSAVVRAPSDVLEGSYKPQDDCITALTDLLDVVEELFPRAICSASSLPKSKYCAASRSVRDFVFYLNNEFRSQHHDKICAKSLIAIENQNIPIERIQKAANAYSRDLNSLLHPEGKTVKKLLPVAMTREPRADNDELVVPVSIRTLEEFIRIRPLSWEHRLANTSAQLVRYWLRTLMNPIPERSDLQTKTDQWNSRLYDCVRLTNQSDEQEFSIEISTSIDDDGSSCSTFDDDKLSSLLSNALAHLYGYLGFGSSPLLERDSWKDKLDRVIPDEECCASIVCQEGFGSRSSPVCLDEEDWQELEEHLRAGSDFCAFHRRALFIERLLTIVAKKKWGDHWNDTVHSAAKKLARLACSNAIQPEDLHLILLGIPVNGLLDRLQQDILPLSRKRYEIVRANLRKTEKNFRLGFSSTKRKKMYQPRIGELEMNWTEWLHPDTKFPSISLRES